MTKLNSEYQFIIIGAGPAGLQMGYFMKNAGMDYVILEKNDSAGSFFATQPVHRKLISINKKYNFFPEEEFNWRHDWNSLLSNDPKMRFTQYTDELFPEADTLYAYFKDYASKFNLNISYNTQVRKIEQKQSDGSVFVLKLDDRPDVKCQVVLHGLGAIDQIIPEEIEGLENATLYKDQSIDLEYYKNKRIAVIGGGNSAYETADYLAKSAAFVHIFLKEPPKMAWDTHFVGDLRAINNNIFDLYQLKSLHAVLNPRIKKIELLDDKTYRTYHEYDYPESPVPGTLKLTREYDIIINCTGWKWIKSDLFDEMVMPEITPNGKFPMLTNNWESTNVKNMYFIGGAMQSIDRKSASGFIHGYRYNIRTLFHLINEKYHSISYPSKELDPFDWTGFLDDMYERFSLSAALFQLFGFLSDVIIFEKGNRKAVIYQELPLEYAISKIPPDHHALVFSLEFGFDKHKGSSLDFLGPSDPNDTKCAAFLHPVIRHYHNGLTDTFHFGDSLLARWDRPHDSGGAVMSYHYDFHKWASEKLGLDVELPSRPESNEAFEVWSAEEIKRHSDMKRDNSEHPCT